MTQNISRSGVRFETSQIYEPGEEVLGKIPWGEWAEAGELSGCVLRVDCPGHPEDGSLSAAGVLDGKTLSRVAVQWKVLPESSVENS